MRRFLGVLSHRDYARIWLASTTALIAVAMYDAASGWMVVHFDPDPRAVSMLRAAVTLPTFFVTLPAGAIADIIDARRLLIFVSAGIAVLAAGFAALVGFDLAGEGSLLGMTFLLSAGLSVNSPAWFAIAPRLVRREEIPGVMATNGVGYQLSRAVGPTLGGFTIARFGLSATIAVLAVANVVAVIALVAWRPPPTQTSNLPAEQLASAVRTGLRHAGHNRWLRAAILHSLAIFPFAASYWSLLPLAASRVDPSPRFYGELLSCISVGTIVGSYGQRAMRMKLSDDGIAATGSIATAIALALFAYAPERLWTMVACLIAGAGWVMLLTSLYSSAERALPAWVKGRGLAVFLTVVFGAMAAGSAAWGWIAERLGLEHALLVGAVGALISIPLVWRWKLSSSTEVDLTPSRHWREPKTTHPIEQSRGPVLVKIEYRIDPADRQRFLTAVDEMGQERKRDGAFAWGVFEDATTLGRFEETYLIESWLELLHLRERITQADRMLEEEVGRMLIAPPKIEFLVSVERRPWSQRSAAPDEATA